MIRRLVPKIQQRLRGCNQLMEDLAKEACVTAYKTIGERLTDDP
jgi:DNA-directed RNA polymerase specialized sigma24 family protein